MNTVVEMSSSDVVAGLVGLLLNSYELKTPFLDLTYGKGNCWPPEWSEYVIGCDIDYTRAKSVCCSFFSAPFKTNAFDLVLYDPPFQPSVGSREEAAYSSMGSNAAELKVLFKKGLNEASRVCSKFLVVKCQHYVHNHEVQWMPLWAVEELGYPFEYLVNFRTNKVVSGRWRKNLSLRRNQADYLVFSKIGNKR